MSKVILASSSPRRKELLKLIFNEFEVCPSNVEEIVPKDLPSEKHPDFLAELKGEDISLKFPDSLVISADTIVLCDGEILGKPRDKDSAFEMLNKLSGKVHKVITGCALFYNGKRAVFSVETDVEFYNLSNEEISNYINTDEPYDKAGGYGIQSNGALFVKGITGDYYNVVGFPVAELKRKLKDFYTE